MEDILVGIIRFLGYSIEAIVSGTSLKKAILYAFLILAIVSVLVYFLTKDF